VLVTFNVVLHEHRPAARRQLRDGSIQRDAIITGICAGSSD
jgi:hypothetical protein